MKSTLMPCSGLGLYLGIIFHKVTFFFYTIKTCKLCLYNTTIAIMCSEPSEALAIPASIPPIQRTFILCTAGFQYWGLSWR